MMDPLSFSSLYFVMEILWWWVNGFQWVKGDWVWPTWVLGVWYLLGGWWQLCGGVRPWLELLGFPRFLCTEEKGSFCKGTFPFDFLGCKKLHGGDVTFSQLFSLIFSIAELYMEEVWLFLWPFLFPVAQIKRRLVDLLRKGWGWFSQIFSFIFSDFMATKREVAK